MSRRLRLPWPSARQPVTGDRPAGGWEAGAGRDEWRQAAAGGLVTAAAAWAAAVWGDLAWVAATGTAALITAAGVPRLSRLPRLARLARPRPLQLVLAAGVVLLLVGQSPQLSDEAGAVLVLAGALAVLAGAVTPLGTVLLAPALWAAADAVPALPANEVAVVAATAAVVLALFDRPGPAIAALSIGPLALASTRPAGLFIAAAGVLITAVPNPLAWLAAVPGSVALVHVLAERRLTQAHVAMAVGLAAVAALLAWRPLPPAKPLSPRHLPAVALLAWLAQRGTALAIAGAALAVALASITRYARTTQEAR